VYQNIDIIESYAPKYMIVLAGDHVYKMDYEKMLQQHVEQGADVTVGCLEVPRGEASGFGIMDVDTSDRILSFSEKPLDPPAMPGRPGVSLASMGIYVFNTDLLIDQLNRDARDRNSSRDFGKDLIPYLVRHGKAVAHEFTRVSGQQADDLDALAAERGRQCTGNIRKRAGLDQRVELGNDRQNRTRYRSAAAVPPCSCGARAGTMSRTAPQSAGRLPDSRHRYRSR
jgi:dTDP-glucose pyrophosphorylase